MSLRRATKPSHDEGGASAVEFALVLPVLLAVVFGLIQYGLYFWAVQGGSAAARDAARRASVGQPVDCTSFRTTVNDSVAGVGDESSLDVTRTYEKAPVNTGPGVEVGDKVEVTLQFKSLDLNFPFVPFINDGLVVATAESRVDYVPAQPEECA